MPFTSNPQAMGSGNMDKELSAGWALVMQMPLRSRGFRDELDEGCSAADIQLQ